VLLLRDRFGIEDNWPVFCEPLGNGCWKTISDGASGAGGGGREFVADVAPDESMKIRILTVATPRSPIPLRCSAISSSMKRWAIR